MSTLLTAAEAEQHSTYSHQHIVFLVRTGRIKGRKSGSTWLVELESLKEYEERMEELGKGKHNPYKDLEV